LWWLIGLLALRAFALEPELDAQQAFRDQVDALSDERRFDEAEELLLARVEARPSRSGDGTASGVGSRPR